MLPLKRERPSTLKLGFSGWISILSIGSPTKQEAVISEIYFGMYMDLHGENEKASPPNFFSFELGVIDIATMPPEKTQPSFEVHPPRNSNESGMEIEDKGAQLKQPLFISTILGGRVTDWSFVQNLKTELFRDVNNVQYCISTLSNED